AGPAERLAAAELVVREVAIGARERERGFRARDRRPVVAVVERDERVALLDRLPLLDEVTLDPAGHAYADRDVAVTRHDVAGAGKERRDRVAGGDARRRCDRDADRTAAQQERRRAGGDGERDRDHGPAPASPTGPSRRRAGIAPALDPERREIGSEPVVAPGSDLACRFRHRRWSRVPPGRPYPALERVLLAPPERLDRPQASGAPRRPQPAADPHDQRERERADEIRARKP